MMKNMNRRIKNSLLIAAVAAVPLFINQQAGAQYRVNADGHALDASNRIGSGGVNPHDSSKRVGDTVAGNDIVTGNVTGGKQFRGRVPYTEQRAFRNGNSSNGIDMDNFIRSSAGSGPDTRMSYDTTRFYGTGRAVPPPPGFMETAPGSGTYIPDPNIVVRKPGDERLGSLDLTNPQVALPQPGEMVLAGQVDPTAGQTYIFASPTAGIRTFSAQEFNGFTTSTQYNPVGMKLDELSIQKLRDELNMAAGAPMPGDAANLNGTSPAGTPGNAVPSNAVNPAIPGNPNNAPNPGAVPLPGAKIIPQQPNLAQPVNNAVAAVPFNTSTAQGTYNIPAPEKQSGLLADMRKRYEDAVADRSLTDEERNRKYNELMKAGDKDKPADQPAGAAAPGAAAPGTATPSTKPSAAVPDFTKRGEEILKSGGVDDKTKKDLVAKRPAPVKVPTLTEGMKGKGFTDLMKTGEQAMKDGKYTLAFENYDKAEQIAPNNPLIKLGRAHTELAATYYARADVHLREVFSAHPEMLVAQYDLIAMLGEARVKTLINDLKDISKKDQREARPLFLLAYIGYNTGHEQEAEAYLDLADKRRGGQDPFFKLLRENWSLPSKPTAPNANK